MQLNAYLNFAGDCAAAFKVYEKCFGGKIVALQTHGESPMADQVPPEWRSKVLHAHLDLGGGAVLMGSDAPPDRYLKPQGFSVSVTVDKPAEAERIFAALAEKGAVPMPIQQTFWAARFGMVVDRFGIPWMVNCNKEA
jgi:PhnB protein